MYHTLHPEASLHVGGARDPEPLRFGAHIEAVSQPKDTRGPPTRASNWSGQWGSNQWQKEWTGEEVSLSQKISGDELREVGLLARLALKHEDTEAAVRSDTSFMLYMKHARHNNHQDPLRHGSGLAQAQGGGQTQPVSPSHPHHWPPRSHEGEDEDGPARGDPPDIGKNTSGSHSPTLRPGPT